jgi:hypothetical protein
MPQNDSIDASRLKYFRRLHYALWCVYITSERFFEIGRDALNMHRKDNIGSSSFDACIMRCDDAYVRHNA